MERRVEELANGLERTWAGFAHRYGERLAVPHDFDPVDAKRRWSDRLEEHPHRLWSTVDCTLYPCVGLAFTDRPQNDDSHQQQLRELTGLPTASAHSIPWSNSRGKVFELVVVHFLDEPVQEPAQRKWLYNVARRAQDLNLDEVRAAMAHATSLE